MTVVVTRMACSWLLVRGFRPGRRARAAELNLRHCESTERADNRHLCDYFGWYTVTSRLDARRLTAFYGNLTHLPANLDGMIRESVAS